MSEDRSLIRKLAEVMAAVERIPKRGRNDFHKYDYATEADIAATIRQELASRHVMLIPAIIGEQRHAVGEKGSVLTVLEMEMEFWDGETGESIVKPWRGYGSDKDDKGGYKAMTGGEKYFLLKTFLMPTGDDPEQHSKEQIKELDKATVKPTKAEKKARPPVPDEGYVYLDSVVPHSKGDKHWHEAITSQGESLILQDHQRELIAIALDATQTNTPVIISAHLNGKGKTEIDAINRWPPKANGAPAPMPTAAEVF